MKSWGARIVERLFGSRSHKETNTEEGETPTLNGPAEISSLQPDPEPYRVQPTKHIEREPNDQAELTKWNAKAKINVKMHKLKMQTPSAKPTNASTDIPTTPLTTYAPMQDPSQSQAQKFRSGLLGDKTAEVEDGPAIGETPERQIVVSNVRRKRKPDLAAQRKVTSEIPTKKRYKANAKAPTDIKPENRAEEFVFTKDNISVLEAQTSPLKRSRKPQPRSINEQVTDEELAELEAENARLKLLLSEKLNSEFSS